MNILNTLVVMSPPTRRAVRPLLAGHRDLRIDAKAETVTEARHVLTMLKFDLVLLEISLSGEEGFELLSAIEPSTRVICFVGNARDMMRALAFGSLHCVSIPIRPAALAEALDDMRLGGSNSPFFAPNMAERAAMFGLGALGSELKSFDSAKAWG